MSPARALMEGDVVRIRARARNGVTYAVHATLADGRRVNQPVAGRYQSRSTIVQQGGAYRWERVR